MQPDQLIQLVPHLQSVPQRPQNQRFQKQGHKKHTSQQTIESPVLMTILFWMLLVIAASPWFPYCAVWPASTGSATPVTKLAASLHSHSTAAAISSGRPSRPKARLAAIASASSSLTGCSHPFNHRSLDCAGANGIAADSVTSVLQGHGLCRTNHAVFGGVVGGPSITADKPAQG